MEPIFKIVPRSLWTEAETTGRFHGAPVDQSDGFIHFSTAHQVQQTAAKHFAGQDDLLLVAVLPAALSGLRWEQSRGGALFPHLYEPLSLGHVAWVKPLLVGAEGRHDFSGLLETAPG